MSSSTQPLQQQQVTVGTITGKQFTVSIQPTDTVRDVKIRIEEEEAIPLETQILMFKEKPLKDTAAIRDLGIRGGSRLQLAVHMTAGPGPITRVRKTKKDDSVVVVLCKQSDGLYMLEFHMKDGESGDKKDAANQLFRLAQGLPPFLLSELAGNNELEDDDENEYDENDLDSDDDSEDDIEDFLEGDERSESTGDNSESDISQSSSSYSSLSTTTFLSLLNARDAFPHSLPDSKKSPATSIQSKKSSRKSTAESTTSRSLLEFSSSARSFNKHLQVKRRDEPPNESETPLSPPKLRRSNNLSPEIESTCIVKKKIRPATAISIMRLSKSSGPGITVVKSRPSTASHIKQTSEFPVSTTCHSLPSLDNSDKEMPKTTLPQNFDETVVASIETIVANENVVSSVKSTSCSESRGKSVRFSPQENPLLLKSTGKPSINTSSKTCSARNARTPMPPLFPSVLPCSPQPVIRKSVRNSPQKRETLVSRAVGAGSSASLRKSNDGKPPVPTSTKPSTCFQCNKKLGPVAVFKCKCSHFYCATHRYSDRHECKFNYKEAGRAVLIKENPKVGGSK
ncbi:UNVERIFIED_CONTAM: Rab5 GDP/GTP exchange factor, partial [Siphonaria sp. JEL0065]